MTENENTQNTAPDYPLEYWLRVADRLTAASFARAFAAEGVTRGEWRTLSALADDDNVVSPGLAARAARGGGRLQSLVARGWVAVVDGAWALTDAGRAAAERLDRIADGVRERIAAAVTREGGSIGAQLEAIARELGWNETLAGLDAAGVGPGFERGFGRGRGFGPKGFGGFRGRGAGFRGRAGYGPAFAGRGFAGDGPVPPLAVPGLAGRGFRGGPGFGPDVAGYGPVDPGFGPYPERRGGRRRGRGGYGPAL
ncbi:MAG: hypothetical protein QM626_07940 [Microbacterium sp.]|uniref:hypothetical protein n=1 Tax=Microbacterium sp. TaxID=51671 RepID=UPI0039E34B7D